MLLNRPLQEATQENYESIGLPLYSDMEQNFAKQLQKNFGKDQIGISNELEQLPNEPIATSGGSTDVAEISWITPTVSIQVAMAGKGIPWHSWAVAASAGLPGASQAAHTAAKVLAATAVDLLTKPALLAAAKQEFIRASAGRAYVSPLPQDQLPTLPQ